MLIGIILAIIISSGSKLSRITGEPFLHEIRLPSKTHEPKPDENHQILLPEITRNNTAMIAITSNM
jgi:hypothetical protein